MHSLFFARQPTTHHKNVVAVELELAEERREVEVRHVLGLVQQRVHVPVFAVQPPHAKPGQSNEQKEGREMLGFDECTTRVV